MNDEQGAPPLQDARLAAARGGMTSATYQPEKELLWESPEGQVANFWVYVLALFAFWLVIPALWAGWRYLCTSKHRYQLTDQRLLEHSGIVIHKMETLELYRIIDIQVTGTLIQSLFGRGQVLLLTHDVSTARVTLNAIPSAIQVATLIRNAVERCRVAKGVRTVDV